jgi:hypothetical protein
MDLEERLKILVAGNIISGDVEKTVLRVLGRFKDRWQVTLNDENGGRMVTHLAIALMRAGTNKEVNPLEREHFEEFKSSEFFVRAVEITEDLCQWVPLGLSEAEREYLVINICLILDDLSEG